MGVGGDGVKLMKSGFIGQRMQQEGISGLQVSTNKPEVISAAREEQGLSLP